VSYADTWYQDAVKATGGWTLELINPTIESGCAGGGNWLASNHPSGGTPGQVNSVFNGTPDVVSPQIISTENPAATILKVCFSEPINPLLLLASNFTISNGIGTPTLVSIDAK